MRQLCQVSPIDNKHLLDLIARMHKDLWSVYTCHWLIYCDCDFVDDRNLLGKVKNEFCTYSFGSDCDSRNHNCAHIRDRKTNRRCKWTFSSTFQMRDPILKEIVVALSFSLLQRIIQSFSAYFCTHFDILKTHQDLSNTNSLKVCNMNVEIIIRVRRKISIVLLLTYLYRPNLDTTQLFRKFITGSMKMAHMPTVIRKFRIKIFPYPLINNFLLSR